MKVYTYTCPASYRNSTPHFKSMRFWYQIMLNIEFYAFYNTTLNPEIKISDNLGEKRPNMTYFDDARFKNINKKCSIVYVFIFKLHICISFNAR